MNASPRNMAIGVCQQCNSSSHYNFGEFGATEACRFCDAAPIDVEVGRHPEIQDEIDDWADDIDCEGGRTMARFVVDYVMDNAEVIA